MISKSQVKNALKCPLIIAVRAVSHGSFMTPTVHSQKSQILSFSFLFISNFKVSYMDRDVRIKQFFKTCHVKCHHPKLPISFTPSSEDLLSINLEFLSIVLAYGKYLMSNSYMASQRYQRKKTNLTVHHWTCSTDVLRCLQMELTLSISVYHYLGQHCSN